MYRSFADLPAVSKLIALAADSGIAVPLLTQAARQLIATRREQLKQRGEASPIERDEITGLARSLAAAGPKRVINATGVILHTNLGRAPLDPELVQLAAQQASGYCDLEYDLAAGERSSRHLHLAALLRELIGCEDAITVNNNAAATVLAIAAVASGKEVICSRGELVEIGGAFRMPEICAMAGARLVAVGTTNKTRIDDYQRAIGPATALLLKVHPSNFATVGFVSEVSVAELAQLGAQHSLPTMMDLGGGCLLSSQQRREVGLESEIGVAEVVAKLDLVTFSGDKLLGGPQAGFVVGRSRLVAAAKKHPWMRALRPDKLTIALLAQTFAAYRDRELHRVRTLAILTTPVATLQARALGLLGKIRSPREDLIAMIESRATPGGGTAPTQLLPSVALAIRERAPELHAALRQLARPIVTRIENDQVVLDLRTIAATELDELADGVSQALAIVWAAH